MLLKLNYIATLIACLTLSISAFAPLKNNVNNNLHQLNGNAFYTKNSILTDGSRLPPMVIQKQRKSMASVQTMSLFGLGGPEIVVIGLCILFLLGPQKLAELARGAGNAATDFKDVPKEFQKGLEEGEVNVRSRKAKPIDRKSVV